MSREEALGVYRHWNQTQGFEIIIWGPMVKALVPSYVPDDCQHAEEDTPLLVLYQFPWKVMVLRVITSEKLKLHCKMPHTCGCNVLYPVYPIFSIALSFVLA